MGDLVLDYRGHYNASGATPFPTMDLESYPDAIFKFDPFSYTDLYTDGTQGAFDVCGYTCNGWYVKSSSWIYYKVSIQHVRYVCPSSLRTPVGEINTSSNGYCQIKVQNADGSKYCIVDAYGYFTEDFRIDSSAETGYIYLAGPPSDFNYTNHNMEWTLTANADGTVNLLVRMYRYHYQTCANTDFTVLDYDLPTAVFSPGEEIFLSAQVIPKPTAQYSTVIKTLAVDLTYHSPNEGIFFLNGCTLDNLESECSATHTPNPDLAIKRTICPGYANGDVTPTEAAFLDLIEVNPVATSYLWLPPTYVRAATAANVPWTFRYKVPIRSNLMHIDSWDYRHSIVLMNEDASKWVRFGRNYTDKKIYLDLYNNHTYFTGTTVHSTYYLNDWQQLLRIWIINNTFYFSYRIGSDNSDAVPSITDFFDKSEPIYVGFSHQYKSTTGTTLYLYRHSSIASWDLLPPGVEARLLAYDIDLSDALFTLPPSEIYMCYVKQSIRNSKNYSDLNSLYAMNPSAPSDLQKPLVAGESCIVFEKHNRIYFYLLKSGYHITELPHFIKMTDNLYWELTEVNIGDPTLIVEQYDIQGLVDTNEVIITHTKHNRQKSYAPVVQLLHNNCIRTEGITIAVKSDTELRISTIETEELTNLKINVYVTP
jgi:hypothetical protein